MTPRIELSNEKKLIGKRLTMSFSDYKIAELWRGFAPRRNEITNNLTNDLISMVVYKPKKISEEQLHVLLNSVGHDTQSRKASDQEYAGIHSCCKYRESEGCSEGNDRKN